MGQGGSVGPSTTTDRSGSVVSNLIGGYNTPEDPTPTLYSNATDDSAVPSNFGTLESGSSTGFRLENGGITLTATGLTSANGYDVVHGSYIISRSAKTITAGDKVTFDWATQGAGDASDVFAYLLNVDTGATQILLDRTWNSPTAASGTSTTTVSASGKYKFVFINGTYDATGGKALGAEMAIDNINIVRSRLPAEEQHLVSQISVLSVEEAQNATDVLNYALEQ